LAELSELKSSSCWDAQRTVLQVRSLWGRLISICHEGIKLNKSTWYLYTLLIVL
jgi:hypothetical protein